MIGGFTSSQNWTVYGGTMRNTVKMCESESLRRSDYTNRRVDNLENS